MDGTYSTHLKPEEMNVESSEETQLGEAHLWANMKYCNGFSQRVSRQRLCKHGDYVTIRKVVFSVPCRTALVANTFPIAR
jgi:hypothetical protein